MTNSQTNETLEQFRTILQNLGFDRPPQSYNIPFGIWELDYPPNEVWYTGGRGLQTFVVLMENEGDLGYKIILKLPYLPTEDLTSFQFLLGQFPQLTSEQYHSVAEPLYDLQVMYEQVVSTLTELRPPLSSLSDFFTLEYATKDALLANLIDLSGHAYQIPSWIPYFTLSRLTYDILVEDSTAQRTSLVREYYFPFQYPCSLLDALESAALQVPLMDNLLERSSDQRQAGAVSFAVVGLGLGTGRLAVEAGVYIAWAAGQQ